MNTREFDHVNVDTTVQEKAVAFPTDARLYHKMRVALVAAAKKREVELRQSYIIMIATSATASNSCPLHLP